MLMRLPSKLLGRVRVGVGVSAVVLGGCDFVDQAQARVFGEDPAVPVAVEEPAADSPQAPQESPEPLLMSRGVAKIVEQSIDRAEAAAPPVRSFESTSSGIGTRVQSEPGAFIPYEGGRRIVAARPTKRRSGRRHARRVVDEPCNTEVGTVMPEPGPKWGECMACGRG